MYRGPTLHVIKNGQGGRSLIRANTARELAFTSPRVSKAIGGKTNRDAVVIGGVDVSTPYIDEIGHRTRCAMYKDIYNHDPLAGAAIDLMCNLPFSDFNLQIPHAENEKDKERIRTTFRETLDRLKMISSLPSIMRDHLVMGAHISILVYKHDTRQFTDTIPIDYDSCEVLTNLLYGRDPAIKVTPSERMSKFLASNTEVAKSLISRLNPDLIASLRGGEFELDPLSAIYYPRRGFTTDDYGNSIYRRILPIYLLEKVLFRGTLTMANRRQSNITHVTAGDEEWAPTSSDLDELVGLVMQADRDPLGAVIATRNDIAINELGRSRDFWQWSEIAQELNDRKLLALGINETFMSGDMSYSSMETALTVFMENLEALRDGTTQHVFTNKLFPLISIINNFTKPAQTQTAAYKLDLNLHDTSNLIMPTIEWHKKLSPKGDEESLEIMDRLSEAGVPFSVRAYAAAGGFDFDKLLAEYQENPKDLNAISEIKKEVEGGDGEEDVFAAVKEVPLASRKFPEESSAVWTSVGGGKRRLVHNQHRAMRKQNRQAALVLRRIAKNLEERT